MDPDAFLFPTKLTILVDQLSDLSLPCASVLPMVVSHARCSGFSSFHTPLSRFDLPSQASAFTMGVRKPMGAREAHIIKRLRSVLKIPVLRIAKAVERDKP